MTRIYTNKIIIKIIRDHSRYSMIKNNKGKEVIEWRQ